MLISKTSFSSTTSVSRAKRYSRRIAVLATVAALIISGMASTSATAGSVRARVAATHGTSTATDLSSARRHHSRGGNAAALAAFAGIVGTIGAIAATRSHDDYGYESGPGYGYYGGGPGYYSGGPAYYGGGYGPYRGYGGGHGYDNSRNQTW